MTSTQHVREAPIGEFRPAYLDELRGIADSAGLAL